MNNKKKIAEINLESIKQLIEVVVEQKLEEKKIATKDDLKHLPTKQDFYERTDKILSKLENIQQDNTVGSHQTSDHEERITLLEDIHPHGQHKSVA